MPYVPLTDDYGTPFLAPGLQVGTIPWRICHNAIQAGDVIVWYSNTSDEKSSYFIKEYSKGPYTHASIYIGDNKTVDAGPNGISINKITDLMKYFEKGDVLRYPEISNAEQQKVVNFAISRVGFRYAHIDVRLLPFRKIAVNSKYYVTKNKLLVLIGWTCILARKFLPKFRSTYCSRLVVDAYGHIEKFGKNYIDEAAISPADLVREPYFEYKGFISNKQTPEISLFDVNAPIRRTEIVFWKPMKFTKIISPWIKTKFRRTNKP